MKIGTLTTAPGRKERGFIEMPQFVGSLRVRFPLLVAVGAEAGPRVALMAAQHGREINGIEVIRRIFKELDPRHMHGSVVAVPVANPLAVPALQQDYPLEVGRYLGRAKGDVNLNRHWPGAADGPLPSQMCHTLMEALIRPADCVIDLHGWTDNSMGMAWATPGHRDLLDAFAMPLSLLKTEADQCPSHHLQRACLDEGIPNVTAELPPQNRLAEKSIGFGVFGVRNVLRHLGLIPGTPEPRSPRYVITTRSQEHAFVAEHNGIVSADFPLGSLVKKGDRIGALYSLDSLLPLQELIAPLDGLFYNIGVEFCEALPPTSIVAPGQTVALVKEVVEVL